MSTLPSWGAVNAYGSWVRIHFGKPSLDVREPAPGAAHPRRRRVSVEGEYQLFVELARWTLEVPREFVATSESSVADIAGALAALEGQILVGASVSAAPPTSVFRFDLGGVLSLAAYADAEPDMELWHLFHGREEIALLASGELLYAHPARGRERRSDFKKLEIGA